MIKLQLLPTPSPFSLGSVNAVSQVSAILTCVFHLFPLQNLETVTSRNLTLTISSPFSYSLPPLLPPLLLTSCWSRWVSGVSPAPPGSSCRPPCWGTWRCGICPWSRSVQVASAAGYCLARCSGDAGGGGSTRARWKFDCRTHRAGRGGVRRFLDGKERQ